MKQEKMIRYMNLIDSKYIAEADPANAKNIAKRKSRTSLMLRYGTLAASFVFSFRCHYICRICKITQNR